MSSVVEAVLSQPSWEGDPLFRTVWQGGIVPYAPVGRCVFGVFDPRSGIRRACAQPRRAGKFTCGNRKHRLIEAYAQALFRSELHQR